MNIREKFGYLKLLLFYFFRIYMLKSRLFKEGVKVGVFSKVC